MKNFPGVLATTRKNFQTHNILVLRLKKLSSCTSITQTTPKYLNFFSFCFIFFFGLCRINPGSHFWDTYHLEDKHKHKHKKNCAQTNVRRVDFDFLVFMLVLISHQFPLMKYAQAQGINICMLIAAEVLCLSLCLFHSTSHLRLNHKHFWHKHTFCRIGCLHCSELNTLISTTSSQLSS